MGRKEKSTDSEEEGVWIIGEPGTLNRKKRGHGFTDEK